ncbi:hypothetical protein B0H63DRAFT_516186 [Podospora didyma]|uniref:Uncharacterized protein n=1 Tax=Podospora didyma TaxID=330526 RepID=A0AAE0P492_9PEZI|nr:hypothetical protein B0H63DRAFT_516186 [Podospora didyma]
MKEKKATIASDPPPVLELAENIALLSLFNQTPTAPKSNHPSPDLLKQDSGRVLSFDREQSLTTIFSFLAGVSDDPDHVVATCVEELPGRKGIRVLVAINKLRTACGDKVLARIATGLGTILGLLSRVNNELHPAREGQVLDAIIEMSRDRILSRIRSRKAKLSTQKKEKAFFGVVVQGVLTAVRTHPGPQASGSEISSFISHTERLQNLLGSIENCGPKDVRNQLGELVRMASRFPKASNFSRLFSGINPKNLNPSYESRFINCLKKLARYRESSLYLFQTARNLDVFEDARVVKVSLDDPHFDRDPSDPSKCDLSHAFSRSFKGSELSFSVEAVCARLGTRVATSNSAFVVNADKALKKSKIHAEIQIIAYYELRPNVKKPRVISSSKDACYMCNLFIHHHGGFHVPRTHGRVYPGWRLPNRPAFSSLRSKMNECLKEQIRSDIKSIMLSKKQRITNMPTESTVFSFSNSMSSLASSIVQRGPGPTSLEQVKINHSETEKHTTDEEMALKSPERLESSHTDVYSLHHEVDGPSQLRSLVEVAITAGNKVAETALQEQPSPPEHIFCGVSHQESQAPAQETYESQILARPDSPHESIVHEPSSEFIERPAPHRAPNFRPPISEALRQRRLKRRQHQLQRQSRDSAVKLLDTEIADDPLPLPKPPGSDTDGSAVAAAAVKMLIQGQVQTFRLDINTTSHRKPIPVYSTGLLNIFLSVVPRPATVRLHWLSEEDVRLQLASRQGLRGDLSRVQSLSFSEEEDSGSRDVVHLEEGGHVVMVEIMRG